MAFGGGESEFGVAGGRADGFVVGLGHDHGGVGVGVGVLAEIGGCAVPELVEFEAGVILRLGEHE